MEEIKQTKDNLIGDFTENYMEKLFYFCLKKTSNHVEAEDLTQDISLNILIALNKGTVPINFSAWVWQIARNRYSAWADAKHRRLESVTGSDIEDCDIADTGNSILDELINGEQLSLLRRELAFIKKDYRNIVVAYYIENKSLKDISNSVSLPLEVVKKRLQRARKILKEGMDMAREFGKRSYSPEQIAFVMNGRDGKKGQPWSIITHLLYKNIFLETYENPQTAEELALELGISLPYMEDELEFLVKEELLKKDGNKYQTNFKIISKEEQRKEHDENKKVQKILTDKLCELTDTYIKENGAKVDFSHIGYENAKWALLIMAFDILQYESGEFKYNGPYPNRPDDGAWKLTGREMIDWEEPPFVGQNGYYTHDLSEIKQNINYSQFKFFYKNIQEKTPTHISYKEALALWLVCVGQTDKAEKIHLDKLTEYGYLKETDGKLEPNLVIFDGNAKDTENEKLSALRKEIDSLFKQTPTITRGYIVEQAINDGWLKYDDNSIKTIGAYIYL